jgi:hypothetical protein
MAFLVQLSEPSTYLELQEQVLELTEWAPNKEDEHVKKPGQELDRMVSCAAACPIRLLRSSAVVHQPEIFDNIQNSFEVIDSVYDHEVLTSAVSSPLMAFHRNPCHLL